MPGIEAIAVTRPRQSVPGCSLMPFGERHFLGELNWAAIEFRRAAVGFAPARGL